MVKCPVTRLCNHGKHVVKCHRTLFECLKTGQHSGSARFREAGKWQSEVYAWSWLIPMEKLCLPAWQTKIKAEVRRLGWMCKEASESKNPRLYKFSKEARSFVAGFVVRETTGPSGVTRRVLSSTMLPVSQRRLE